MKSSIAPYLYNGDIAWQCVDGCPAGSLIDNSDGLGVYGDFCVPAPGKCFKIVNQGTTSQLLIRDVTSNDYVAKGICYNAVNTTKVSETTS